MRDKKEEECGSIFEFFVITAEAFLSQKNGVCCGEFLECAISALWENAKNSRFPDLTYLNSLPTKEKCRMVTEFFDELMEEVIADCESELEVLASIRNFAAILCQEAESSSDVSVHSDQTQENIPTQLNL